MSYEVPHMEGDDEIQFGSLPEGGWPRWEAFVRQNGGLVHVHSESVHAPDAETALLNARDTYLRRVEGVSLWVIPTDQMSVWESGGRAARNPRHCAPPIGAMGGLRPPSPRSGSCPCWIAARHRARRRNRKGTSGICHPRGRYQRVGLPLSCHQRS